MSDSIRAPRSVVLSAIVLGIAACAVAQGTGGSFSFFVTSAGPGKGARLRWPGGRRPALPELAPGGRRRQRVWRAYLSTQAKAL